MELTQLMKLIVNYKDVNLDSNVTPITNTVTGMEPLPMIKKKIGVNVTVNTPEETDIRDFTVINTVPTRLVVKTLEE